MIDDKLVDYDASRDGTYYSTHCDMIYDDGLSTLCGTCYNSTHFDMMYDDGLSTLCVVSLTNDPNTSSVLVKCSVMIDRPV